MGDGCDADDDDDSLGMGDAFGLFFRDEVEAFLARPEDPDGLDPLDACADTSTPNDERGPGFGEPLSPLPPDLNDDRFMDITDIVVVAGFFGQTVPPAPARVNIAPIIAPDGFVDFSDITKMAAFFGLGCV